MQLFYLENPNEEIELSTEESKHIRKVLRKNEKDILNFTDGKGHLLVGEIISTKNKKTRVKIIKKEKKEKQHNYYLHIAIAPTKNIDRFEWFLEKATEIGVDEITPIICDHSERKTIKEERCKRILLSAMKQSLKFYTPRINEVISLKEFLRKDYQASKYIAHCEEGEEGEEAKTNLKKENTDNSLILIGPEGDFSTNEIKLAITKKFKPITLGNCRLRTETAGIIATHTINLNY